MTDSQRITEPFELDIMRLDEGMIFGYEDYKLFYEFLIQNRYFITYQLLLQDSDTLEVWHFDVDVPPIAEIVKVASEKKGIIKTPYYLYVEWVWFILAQYMLDHVSPRQREMLLEQQDTINFAVTAYNFILDWNQWSA